MNSNGVIKMRLIDADAEIKKIEEEIERSYKAIDRWRSRGMPGSSLYDIDVKVRQIKNNIADCKREIRMLKSYTTAYNPEAIVKKLEDKIEYAGRLMVEKPADKLDEIANDTAEDYIQAYIEAIEVVREEYTWNRKKIPSKRAEFLTKRMNLPARRGDGMR